MQISKVQSCTGLYAKNINRNYSTPNFGAKVSLNIEIPDSIKTKNELLKFINKNELSIFTMCATVLGMETKNKSEKLSPEEYQKNLEFLKSKNYDIYDINARDQYNNTALHRDSARGHIDIVQALLNVDGIDVNAKGFGNRTPLHHASFYGHKDVVKALREIEGIDINAKDCDGRTALIRACVPQGMDPVYYDVVKLLLGAKDIDVNVKDKYHNTALDYAKKNSNVEIINLLKQHNAK